MSRTPALKVRVAVTGRSVIATLTWSSPTASTPVGRSSPTLTVRSDETPVIGICGGVDPDELGQLVGVAFDKDDRRIHGDRWRSRTRPPDRRVTTAWTGSVRVSRSEKTGMVMWLEPGSTSTWATASPSSSIGHQLDVLVDVDPGLLDDHARAGGDDPLDDRRRAKDLDRGRVGDHVPELEAVGRRARAPRRRGRSCARRTSRLTVTAVGLDTDDPDPVVDRRSTRTGTRWGPLPGWIPLRSIDASKSDEQRARPDGAK